MAALTLGSVTTSSPLGGWASGTASVCTRRRPGPAEDGPFPKCLFLHVVFEQIPAPVRVGRKNRHECLYKL